MMRERLFCLCTAVLAMVSSAVAAGATETPASAAPRTEIRVGIATNYPPLAFKQRGEIKGVEADFAHKLADELGTKMTLVETPFPELIPALLAGHIDIIMSGMSITDERKNLVSFTHSYLRVGQMLLLRKSDAQRFRSDAAIDRPTTRVGVVRGTTGETYARAHLAHARIQAFDAVDAGVSALRTAGIDVFIHDAPSIWQITGGFDSPEHQLTGRYEPLTEEYLAWATRKDDDLHDRLNAVLRQWHDNGELERVLNKWIRTTRWAVKTPAHQPRNRPAIKERQ